MRSRPPQRGPPAYFASCRLRRHYLNLTPLSPSSSLSPPSSSLPLPLPALFSFLSLSLSPLSPLASFSLSLSLSFLLSSLLLLVSPSFLSLLPHPSLLSPPYRCSLALASLTLSLPSFLSLSPLSSLVFFCYVIQLLWDRKPQCRNGEGAPPRGRGAPSPHSFHDPNDKMLFPY